MAAEGTRDAAYTPMRVLMVTPRFAPELGGVESHVRAVSRRLHERGVHVEVLTTDRSRALPTRDIVDGVLVRRLPAWPARRDYHVATGLLREQLQGRWDVVHIQSYHTLVAPLAMRACLRQGMPYVLTFHGGGHSSRLRQRLRGPQWRALGPLLRRAERLVAVAAWEIDEYGRRLGVPRERFALIPNGADLPAAGTRAAGYDTNGNGHDVEQIVSIGRLERYKGHQRVIEAMVELTRLRPRARLLVLGSGPYEAKLRRLVARRGLEDRVAFDRVAPDDRQRLADVLASSRAAVQLSDFETHPIAAIEAAAAGLPVLVTETSGLAELAANGHAVSVALNAPAGTVAARLAEILEHPPRYRPCVAELPSWDGCAAALHELYAEIVGDQPAAVETREPALVS